MRRPPAAADFHPALVVNLTMSIIQGFSRKGRSW
jgi:hypothetical protein